MTTSSEPPNDIGDPIDAALEAFQNAWFAGEKPDPESFCKAHPECEPELRQQIDSFLLALDLLPEIGSSTVGAEPNAELDESLAFPGKEMGDFRLLAKIGRGGMGVVYEAEQVSLNRKVALKILPAHMTLSGEAVKKFHREAEAGGRQKHPGIVAVYAMGEQDGLHYIVQELIEGRRTLADRLVEMKRLHVLPRGYYRDAAKLVLKVAEALAHAHDSGVIHRDVKPPNILLTKAGEPKVSDFGLAMIENALALSSTGSFAGTPYYMSPEQASGKRSEIDARTDVFSLGVTLYELLTLTLPFEGDTSHEVLKKIIIEEPRDPCRISKRIPHDLAVICLKALEKDPRHRYGSMQDFADDLGRFLNNEPIFAKRAGIVVRLAKRIKRNPSKSALTIMIPVVVILGTLTTLLYRITRENRNSSLVMESQETLDSNPGKAFALAKTACQIFQNEKATNALLDAMCVCHEQETHLLPPNTIPLAVHQRAGEILNSLS